MRDDSNARIYRRWAPFYDAIMGPFYEGGRRRAVRALDLRAGDSLLVPGIGTGLEIPAIPDGVRITGLDLTPEMLARARERSAGRPGVVLMQGNAQELPFDDESFDAVLCDLVLSVVPDAAAAFAEAWRVLRPAGRLVVFDKFVPEGRRVTVLRRAFGRLAELVGTDVNRRFEDIVGDTEDVEIVSDDPDLFGGQYRVIVLRKRAGAA